VVFSFVKSPIEQYGSVKAKNQDGSVKKNCRLGSVSSRRVSALTASLAFKRSATQQNQGKCWVSFLKRHFTQRGRQVLQVGKPAQRTGSGTPAREWLPNLHTIYISSKLTKTHNSNPFPVSHRRISTKNIGFGAISGDASMNI
jgi:hypothetical protein